MPLLAVASLEPTAEGWAVKLVIPVLRRLGSVSWRFCGSGLAGTTLSGCPQGCARGVGNGSRVCAHAGQLAGGGEEGGVWGWVCGKGGGGGMGGCPVSARTAVDEDEGGRERRHGVAWLDTYWCQGLLAWERHV